MLLKHRSNSGLGNCWLTFQVRNLSVLHEATINQYMIKVNSFIKIFKCKLPTRVVHKNSPPTYTHTKKKSCKRICINPLNRATSQKIENQLQQNGRVALQAKNKMKP